MKNNVWLMGDEGDLMRWAIYDEQVDDWTADLTAPTRLKDGVYEAEYISNRLFGVEIKDGKFVPEPTMTVAYLLALQRKNQRIVEPDERFRYGEPLDHRYLERLHWNGVRFELFIGS